MKIYFKFEIDSLESNYLAQRSISCYNSLLQYVVQFGIDKTN